MKAPYFIETLARNGEVLHRHQIAGLPIRLGRGYDNDVILDDAHTAPHHAVVELADAGQLTLRDLGSRNGIVHDGKRRGSVPLEPDTVVRLGHTTLRVRGADCPVPPELADTTMHGWEGGAPAAAGLALIGLVVWFTTWLGDSANFQAIHYAQTAAAGLGAGLIWSGVWALVNRLFGGCARLGRHLFILGCGLATLELWKMLSAALAYAYSLEWLTRYGSPILIGIVCVMVYYHLHTVRPRHPRRLAGACAALLALGTALTLMSNLQRTGRLSDELYMTLLLPPALRQSPNHTPDQFFAATAKLQAGADAERGKAVKSGGDEDSEDE